MQISIHPPLAEFLEGNSVREAFAADTDSLKHTIAPKLMQDETGLDHSRFLVLVGDNTANKMRTCAVQSIHQTTQWLLNTQRIWFKRNLILSTGFSLRIGVAGEYYIRVKGGLLWKGKAPSGYEPNLAAEFYSRQRILLSPKARWRPTSKYLAQYFHVENVRMPFCIAATNELSMGLKWSFIKQQQNRGNRR